MALAPKPKETIAQNKEPVEKFADEKVISVVDSKSGNKFEVTASYFAANKATLKRA